ncbi:MAG: Rho termination factor [Mangrovibacterium sp.]
MPGKSLPGMVCDNKRDFNRTDMPNKERTSKIKNERQYEALREKGYSKQKSARIANTPDSGERGGHSSPYEERSRKELYEKAKKVGIKGRSKMSKTELTEALRNN